MVAEEEEEEEEDRKEHPWLIVVFQLFYRHHVCVCAVFFLVRQQVEFRFNCVWYMLKFVQASYLLECLDSRAS